MKHIFSTFIAGLLFGIGLTISQMVNPAKVLAFLDITGDWDPSLAFVMGGALITTFIGYKFVLKKKAPLFDESFKLPTRQDIDLPLVIGAALFGIGWGLSGLCPGPALASLTFGGHSIFLFLASMLLTVTLFQFIRRPS